MPNTSQKRATIYFDEALHRALRFKAAETERSISDLVNEAVQLSLAADVEAFSVRGKELDIAIEEVILDMKKRGKL